MGIVEIVLFSLSGLFLYVAPMILAFYAGYNLKTIRENLSHAEIWFIALMPLLNIAAPSAFSLFINSENSK